jgi:hypothetical protein
MSDYAVAHLDEIDEMDDGRCPWRPVRHHLGITAFGVNAWTGQNAGDRIINEHDEDEEDGNEELYLVQRGKAVFELDGDRVDARRHLRLRPTRREADGVAEEPETTIIAFGGTPGKAYEVHGWELWAPLRPLYEAGEYAEAADRGRIVLEADPRMPTCSTTSPAARASPARRTRRSDTSGAQSKSRSVHALTRRTIGISIRSATRPRSRS